MPQCTPTQHSNNENKKTENKNKGKGWQSVNYTRFFPLEFIQISVK
jgi:hypothetical protein